MPSGQSTWLISVPQGDEAENIFSNLSLKLHQGSKLADVAQVVIPVFKTGTLDSLISLSDSLPKEDSYFTSVVVKILEVLRNLMNDDQQKLLQHIQVNEDIIDNYVLENWGWNDARYSLSKGLHEIMGILNKEMASIDNMMKSKLSNYNSVKNTLVQMQRRKTGNLAIRSLLDIVSRENYIADSEYMETILVAVPKNLVRDWQTKYERLSPMVIPRSSSLVAIDDEYSLFSVAIFKRARDEFKQRCRENQFTTRDFAFSEEALARQRRDLDSADTAEKELWVELLHVSRTNFSEAFQSLVHLKIIRLFVESVLRYGLPAKYLGLFIKPEAQSFQKTLSILSRQFSYLPKLKDREIKLDIKSDRVVEETGEFQRFIDEEIYDFVLFEIPWMIS